METIISALISAGVTLIICLVQNNKTKALMEYKLDELTSHVAKHNNLIERMYIAEKDISVIQNDIKVANHRIEDLEAEATK